MKYFDIIIIGGGASGCMCAITASKKDKSILIIDSCQFLGKKLMVTGNGRCNLTNTQIFPTINYYNQDINKYINILSPNQTLDFFKKLGLICYVDEENRVYPISNNAKSVVDVINNKIQSCNNISVSLKTSFVDLTFANGKYTVKTDIDEFIGEKVVIATGGESALSILKKFSIPTKTFTESLVALKTQSTRILDGIRISPVKLSAQINNSESFIERGEVLFKDSGLSGIVAFNASTVFARKGKYEGTITLDLLPDFSYEHLQEVFNDRKKLNLPINKMFDGIFIPQLAYFILNKCKINENRTIKELKQTEIGIIIKTIKSLTFNVKSHYNNNQVYSGGVTLSNLTEHLESKQQKGLFFCGEICDVDGKCGGYNLQWAWTSGYIVGDTL